jgi:autoinducer 2-degrading protein
MAASLLVVHVQVQLKPGHVEAFREATRANAAESVKEPGVARFDVLQDEADDHRFLLVEVYRTDDAPAAHKETAHYKLWRDTVAAMMAAPRTSIKNRYVFDTDAARAQ